MIYPSLIPPPPVACTKMRVTAKDYSYIFQFYYFAYSQRRIVKKTAWSEQKSLNLRAGSLF